MGHWQAKIVNKDANRDYLIVTVEYSTDKGADAFTVEYNIGFENLYGAMPSDYLSTQIGNRLNFLNYLDEYGGKLEVDTVVTSADEAQEKINIQPEALNTVS